MVSQEYLDSQDLLASLVQRVTRESLLVFLALLELKESEGTQDSQEREGEKDSRVNQATQEALE